METKVKVFTEGKKYSEVGEASLWPDKCRSQQSNSGKNYSDINTWGWHIKVKA
jgi:hypothetical protein